MRSRQRERHIQPKRDPHHAVVRHKSVCLCAAGKTSETMIRNEVEEGCKVVTNFNQFGRIMSLNQADMRRDQKADPEGTRLEIGNVSWPRTEKHRPSARLSLTSGAPSPPPCSTPILPSRTT